MFQRIQSLFLFWAVLLDLSLFVLPVATFQTANGDGERLTAASDWVLGVLVVLGALCSSVSMALFKNRPLQAIVANVGMFVILATAGYAAFRIASSAEAYSLGLGLLIPLLSANMTAFAVKAIRKDEELVRSSERLR
jgi:hypothetical protein